MCVCVCVEIGSVVFLIPFFFSSWGGDVDSICCGISCSQLHVMNCHFHVLSCTVGALGFPGAAIKP